MIFILPRAGGCAESFLLLTAAELPPYQFRDERTALPGAGILVDARNYIGWQLHHCSMTSFWGEFSNESWQPYGTPGHPTAPIKSD